MVYREAIFRDIWLSVFELAIASIIHETSTLVSYEARELDEQGYQG